METFRMAPSAAAGEAGTGPAWAVDASPPPLGAAWLQAGRGFTSRWHLGTAVLYTQNSGSGEALPFRACAHVSAHTHGPKWTCSLT